MYPGNLLLSLCLLCLLCLLCPIIAAGTSEPQIAFSVPGLLQSNQTAKGCLEVKYHTQPVDVNIVLEIAGENHTIINEQVPVDKTFMCPEFQVPSVVKSVPVFIIISAQCENFHHTSRRPVVVAPTASMTFIQTEKYMFKAGDTVHFNVFTLLNTMTPKEEIYTLIFVTDPNGNRLYQWKDQKTENGFLSLNFELLRDQELGIYTITVTDQSSKQTSQQIKVEEYVLPKFRMDIEAPNTITILDEKMVYKVTATYTYGKGVPGNVTIRICRPPANYYPAACNRNPDGLCFHSTGKLDSNGSFSGELDLTTSQLDRSGYQMYFQVKMTVTEDSTNVQITESKFISITSQLGRVYFIGPLNEYYKKGIGYPFKIKVEDGTGKPLDNQTVEIQVNGKKDQNVTTGPDGTAHGEIDTSAFVESVVSIQAIYRNPEQCYDSNWIVPSYSNAYHQITRFYSLTDSFVQISGPTEELQCGQKYDLKVRYLLGKESLKEGDTTANFIYMVTSGAKIVQYGEHPIDVSTSLQGEFSIPFEPTSDNAPSADLIVYYLSMSEVVADSIRLDIEKCFKNQVSVTFSEESGTPGSNVLLELKAAAKSLCAYRVIDSSLQLLEQGQQVTAETVYSSRQYNILNGYYVDGYNIEPTRPPCVENIPIRIGALYYSPMSYPNEGDTYGVFSKVGMTFGGSNISVFKPEVCGQSGGFFSGGPINFRPVAEFAREPVFTSNFVASDTAAVSPEINTVRTFFPEVWAFQTKNVGENGSASVQLEVPGTITKWKGDMICLSKDDGIGMTKYTANFTGFQTFFGELSLPYSIVRKETLHVRAFLSNYMDKCAKVRATLSPSPDFTAEPVDEDNEKCICSGQRASYSWKLNALSLGVINISLTGETVMIGDSCEGPADPNQPSRKDTVVQTVIVEAEGVSKDETKSDYICVNGTDKVITISIPNPENIVAGSQKATLNVIGDLLGSAITNPESMIREPTGCGEQILATLSPLPQIVQYMNLTDRLTDEIKERAIYNMAAGYRKLIAYRNRDGSFSAFGSGGYGGSAMLTTQAVGTLQEVSKYTFVDEKVLNQGVLFIERLQDPSTGKFSEQGSTYNSAWKGSDPDVAFTAKVCDVLLNGAYATSPTLLRSALAYLEQESKKDLSNYDLAMVYNTFQTAGNTEGANAVLQKLKERASNEDGTIHWQRSTTPQKQSPLIFSPPAASVDIEMTSYVLLGMTKMKSPSQEDMNYMSKIALGLLRQQNAHGSYRTTSDTMVVLQALCAFGLLTYQKDATNAVELKYGEEVIRDFNLDGDNRILLQKEPLSHVPGDYSVTISGNGCVLVQTAVEYNIPVSQEEAAFSLSVETAPDSCVNGVAYTIPLSFNASYHGIKNQSNMALLDFKLPSGYSVEYQSLNKLKTQVAKVEQKNNHVIIYLLKVTNEMISFSLTLEMSAMVSNLQPTTATLYDYYDKDENGAVVFHHPCSTI